MSEKSEHDGPGETATGHSGHGEDGLHHDTAAENAVRIAPVPYDEDAREAVIWQFVNAR